MVPGLIQRYAELASEKPDAGKLTKLGKGFLTWAHHAEGLSDDELQQLKATAMDVAFEAGGEVYDKASTLGEEADKAGLRHFLKKSAGDVQRSLGDLTANELGLPPAPDLFHLDSHAGSDPFHLDSHSDPFHLGESHVGDSFSSDFHLGDSHLGSDPFHLGGDLPKAPKDT